MFDALRGNESQKYLFLHVLHDQRVLPVATATCTVVSLSHTTEFDSQQWTVTDASGKVKVQGTSHPLPGQYCIDERLHLVDLATSMPAFCGQCHGYLLVNETLRVALHRYDMPDCADGTLLLHESLVVVQCTGLESGVQISLSTCQRHKSIAAVISH